MKSGQRASAESQRVIRSASTRIISVLIGYPLGGGLIGWTLDLWLDTLPWITLGLMFVGFGLGFREILKSAKRDPKRGSGRELSGGREAKSTRCTSSRSPRLFGDLDDGPVRVHQSAPCGC